jgi:predicted permease
MVATATCVLCGIIPAIRSTKTDPATSIKSGQRGLVGSREHFWAQRTMVVVQIAVSMVLLVAALLFVHSYRNLMSVDPGLRESGITIGYFGFDQLKIKPENLAAFKRNLVDEVRAIPGIENAAATNIVPLSGASWGHQVVVGTLEGASRFSYVSPSFFATLGIPLQTGRNFTVEDTNGAPLVLIVNQAFVRKYVSTSSALGVRVHVQPEPQYPERTYQIVGTVADSKYSDVRDQASLQAFVSSAQLPETAQQPGLAMIFASRDRAAGEQSVRRLFQQKHAGMNAEFHDYERDIGDNLVGDRLMARLAGFFGVLAAILVVVGLHGVLSYFLAQRRSEIGIRMALGAGRGRVVRSVLGNAGVMLLIGLVAGMALAVLLGRAASRMLFELRPWDLGTLAGAAILLGAVTVIASVVPAMKAASVSPIEALRTE